MKLIPVAVLACLILLVTAPDESEAVPAAWFARIAWALGVKLVKNSYYARCNTRYVPAGINCPSVVYGVGLSRMQAQKSAKCFAGERCARYVGHCKIRKFMRKGK